MNHGINMNKVQRQFDYEAIDQRDVLQYRVTLTSMFIATYEHCKDGIVSQARSCFTVCGKLGDKYGKEVLGRHKKLDVSTLLWIQENGGITSKEIERYEEITKLRNELVHEYIHVLTDKNFPLDKIFQCFLDTISLIERTDSWFFQQSPEFAIIESEQESRKIGEVISQPALILKKIFLMPV